MPKIVTLVVFLVSSLTLAEGLPSIQLLRANGSVWKELPSESLRCLRVENTLSLNASTNRETLEVLWQRNEGLPVMIPQSETATLRFMDSMGWEWKPLGEQENYVSSCKVTEHLLVDGETVIRILCKNLMVVNDDYPAKSHLQFEFSLSSCQ